MNENKCIYCNFKHPDNIGAEIYSGEYIPEEVMYDSEWIDGYEYAFLKQKNGYFVLVTLHSDNEFYSWDGDETSILYCPMCGRKLSKMTNEQEQCPYCHSYKYDAYLYAEDIFAITKHLYGKAQQVKWTGKALSNYEAEYDDYNESVCRVGRYDDGKIVCTNEEKYFLAVDTEMPLGTTYFPINCCPICRRNFNDTKNA